MYDYNQYTRQNHANYAKVLSMLTTVWAILHIYFLLLKLE